ncbi:MAG: DUF2851 family protein [Dehalococcoidales bacterium]|nr:DUF2851 family protein [Dehalococcoidales bacterium]
MKRNLTENQVTGIWQDLISSRHELTTEAGEPLKVVYPGRVSDGAGADFQDAVITIGQRILKGNIEVHVKSSDWQTHGHHRNPAYNGIILHVVMQHDSRRPTSLENGGTVPVIVLGKYEEDKLACPPYSSIIKALPCKKAAVRYRDRLLKMIDIAGDMRFDEKTAEFQTALKVMEAGQCLYRGIMRALGYARNQMPFLELAERVPLQAIEQIASLNGTGRDRLLRLQAKLFGTAGLLPSQRQDLDRQVTDTPWVNDLENEWQISGNHNAMSFTGWKLFRIRPANSPLRRLAGMSCLALRYRGKGILTGLLELARETPMEKAHRYLEEGLMVSGDEYWANHFDFGKTWTLNPWLIGRSRAADIVVNVLLPFVSARGRIFNLTEPGEKASNLYRTYPAIQENTIQRHLRTQFGLKTTEINSAQRQQGLLHIYKKWCTQGRCGECPLPHVNFKSGTTSRDRPPVLPA